MLDIVKALKPEEIEPLLEMLTRPTYDRELGTKLIGLGLAASCFRKILISIAENSKYSIEKILAGFLAFGGMFTILIMIMNSMDRASSVTGVIFGYFSLFVMVALVCIALMAFTTINNLPPRHRAIFAFGLSSYGEKAAAKIKMYLDAKKPSAAAQADGARTA